MPHATDIKAMSQAHAILPRVFVTGDLNVDFVITGATVGKVSRVDVPAPRVGGSAYNAAVAFKRAGFDSLLFGNVGDDHYGRLIFEAVTRNGIEVLVGHDPTKPTGTCHLLYFEGGDHLRTIYYFGGNANDYDPIRLERALTKARLTPTDLVFSSLHMYDQTDRDFDRCQAFFGMLRSSGAKLVLDVVPHTLYEVLTLTDFHRMIGGTVDILIGEYQTLARLANPGITPANTPNRDDFAHLARHFDTHHFLCRYGIGNIGHEVVFTPNQDTVRLMDRATETGYDALPVELKRGFGDDLTAMTLRQLLTAELPLT